MADAFTQVSSVSTVQTAYDRVAYFALRSQPQFSQFASVKPGNPTSPGSAVTFTFWTEMSTTTATLTETVDVDAVALADSQVTVTPAERGNAILISRKVRATTFTPTFDADAANLIAYNMVNSLDVTARVAWDAAGTESYVTAASEAAITASNIITANHVRQKQAKLVAASVMPVDGTYHGALIHPHVSYDLKKETGDAAWVTPNKYANVERIYNNEFGTFAGFRFIESPRAKLNTDGGASAVDTYTTYFFGAQAIAYAEAIPPHTVIGEPTDKLKRFWSLGWYAYNAWGQFRSASLERLLSASSMGANT